MNQILHSVRRDAARILAPFRRRALTSPALPTTAGALGTALATVLGTVTVLAVLAAGGCGPSKADSAARAEATPVPVRARTLHVEDAPRMVEAVGSLRSDREAVLSGKMMGTVVEIRKQAGEAIRRGEILVVIDSRDLAGQISQAEGALAQARAAATLAEANLGRFEQLASRNAASKLELDQARYQAETARGAVAQAEGAVATASSYRSYAEIPAPFDGRVVDRMVEVGDLAAPGRPLLRIEDPSRMRLEVTVSEGDLAAARTGAPVRVEIPSLGAGTMEGTIREAVPALDPATHSMLVKIALPSVPDLRTGLFARARLAAGSRRVLQVPASAVLHRGGMTGVFAAENGHATFRLITVNDGPSTQDANADPDAPVEVLSGLSDGDLLIVSPPSGLREGSPIEVRHE